MGKLAAPAARLLAKDLGVAIEGVEGSGKRGYVTVADVRRQAALPADGIRGNGKGQADVHEDYEGEVLPVSALYKLRFRQDNGSGVMLGEDLLAIRPKAVGGRFRSSEGILGWFVADRGFFAEPVEVEPERPVDKAPEITPLLAGAGALAVTE